MCKTALPFGFRTGVFEMVVMIAEIVLRHIIRKLATWQGFLLHAGIDTRMVECKRIFGCEHTDIRENGGIVFCMAIAVGRNINDQRDVEARSSVYYSFRIFSHTTIQYFVSVIIFETNGIEIARAETSAATDALFRVDRHFLRFFVENKTSVCALA